MIDSEVFLVLTGFLIGSAVDAAADRVERGKSWMLPRSRCNSCHRPLRWFELVPIMGWALSGGRCRRCGAPIGWSAPITEMAGALIPLTAILVQGGDPEFRLLTIMFGWLLLTLAAIDFRIFILPDRLTLPVFCLGCAMVIFYEPDGWGLHLAGAVAGYGLLRLVETAYRRTRGRDGIGRGDAKLLGAIGIWVGLGGLAPVLLVASLCGIAHVLVQSALTRQPASRLTAIPFGPWIALAGYGVFLFPPL